MQRAALRWCSALGLLCAQLGCGSSEATPPNAGSAPAEQSVPASTVPNSDSSELTSGGGTPEPQASASGSPAPEPSNSQTGSPGAVECNSDSDCALGLDVWTRPLGSLELLGATCGFPGQDAQPACYCELRRTPAPDTAGASEPYVLGGWPGIRPGGCSEYDRTSGCSYCEQEFPGCNIDDASSCDAVCADFYQRQAREFARTFSARERLARCNADNRCERLYELEGRCYVGAPGRPEARSYDCALSDAELLAQSELASVPSCAARPDVSCSSASDCPAGLACKDGVCGPCVEQCVILDSGSTCRGGGECAAGESCAADTCVPDANVTCRSFSDCGPDRVCAVSGVDWTQGRGNASTRSFCR
jgi:hypothetical protein